MRPAARCWLFVLRHWPAHGQVGQCRAGTQTDALKWSGFVNDISTGDLCTGFAEPLLPFVHFVAAILVALSPAAFVGFYLGRVEYRRRDYEELPPEQVPGGTWLGAMLALLGLLLGFAFRSALGWREARHSALVEEAMATGTAFLTADLLDDPGRTELQTRILR